MNFNFALTTSEPREVVGGMELCCRCCNDSHNERDCSRCNGQFHYHICQARTFRGQGIELPVHRYDDKHYHYYSHYAMQE